MNKLKDISIRIKEETLCCAIISELREYFGASASVAHLYCILRNKLIPYPAILCIATTVSGQFLGDRAYNIEQTYRPHKFASLLVDFSKDVKSNPLLIAISDKFINSTPQKNNIWSDLGIVSDLLLRNKITLTYTYLSDDPETKEILANISNV